MFGIKKKVKVEEVEIPVFSEKNFLLALYQELKDRKIDRISDLENQIANCKD